MGMALREARKGLGRTSPNPAVGAVIVKNGQVVSKGFHRKAGSAHAEVEALKALGGKAPGCTMYVTLEPCHHHGRTPPCTHAVLKSGISRVVVGMKDPNPHVSGGGCEFLRKNKVKVTLGVLEAECRLLNEAFIKHVLSRRPFVIAKSAMTLDGWTATATGHSRWITNEKSRRFVHRLRNQVDAIMVGVGTIIADNPRLNTRMGPGKGKDPMRIVVDTHLRTPLNAGILALDSTSDTIIVVGNHVPDFEKEKFTRKGVLILACPTRDNRIDLTALMGVLADKSVCSILLEGGASVMGSMIRERLIDKFYIFKGARILGGNDGVPMAKGEGPSEMDRCVVLKDVRFRRFGDDFLTVGYPEYK